MSFSLFPLDKPSRKAVYSRPLRYCRYGRTRESVSTEAYMLFRDRVVWTPERELFKTPKGRLAHLNGRLQDSGKGLGLKPGIK